MHVDVIISTFNRFNQLKKCIKTIKESSHKDVSILVMVDGNKNILEEVKAEPVTMFFNATRKDFVVSMNTLLSHSEKGAVLYGSDDLEFPSDCIFNAVAALEKHFPDTDGLIGLKSVNIPSAFGLMGRKFINRFPNNQVFCPEYIHYASDWELGRFAETIHRFYHSQEAIVHHVKTLSDITTKLAVMVKSHDEALRLARIKKGACWGIDFKCEINE